MVERPKSTLSSIAGISNPLYCTRRTSKKTVQGKRNNSLISQKNGKKALLETLLTATAPATRGNPPSHYGVGPSQEFTQPLRRTNRNRQDDRLGTPRKVTQPLRSFAVRQNVLRLGTPRKFTQPLRPMMNSCPVPLLGTPRKVTQPLRKSLLQVPLSKERWPNPAGVPNSPFRKRQRM